MDDHYPGDKLLLVKLIEIIKLTSDLSGRDLGSIKVYLCRASFQRISVARRS